VCHLQWNVAVDFELSVLRATARYTIRRVEPGASILSLDTSKLEIDFVCDEKGKELDHTLYAEEIEKPYLGQRLDIVLTPGVTHVEISYETTPQSSALQWLPPAQTAGKLYPYLFTQCQAIHARSLLPCQDRPGVKMTYKATVSVPRWATCVMSAVQMIQQTSPKNVKTFVWMQDVPVSSYLIALAVGDLRRKEISARCAVWSEPQIVDKAAEEYSQTEDFLRIAEDIAGMPYVWGRYDLLCMPPSFPYGGMENPCLTFITPTTLAGDKSLADVVAHEIAHSWTGNLVTNATWDHFWLNEGWTTWFQRKIMARIHNDDRFLDFDAIGGYKDLRDTCEDERMPDEFKKLVLDVGDNDPDDSYSTIAYEKGFNLLLTLERRVGKEAFEYFFQSYVKHYSSQPLTSDEFRNFFSSAFPNAMTGFEWEKWLHESGMPPEEPSFDRGLALEAEILAEAWLSVDQKGPPVPELDISAWTSNQKICFLDTLQTLSSENALKVETVQQLDKVYGFAKSQNAEVLFRHCQIALASEDESILPVVLKFVTSQGRMKFTRPLYRALFASARWRKVAKAAFLEHKDFYHPICSKMVANDLLQIEGKESEKNGSLNLIKDAIAKMNEIKDGSLDAIHDAMGNAIAKVKDIKDVIVNVRDYDNVVLVAAASGAVLFAAGMGMMFFRRQGESIETNGFRIASRRAI